MTWLWLAIIVIIISFGFVVFCGAPYVPSNRSQIKRALTELYPLTKDDVLVDIGSGDGVVLRETAKIGARAVGYEINPFLVIISRLLSYKYKKITVKLADFWLTHLPNGTTVVYVFSVSRDINKIVRYIQNEANRLGKKIYVISYGIELINIKPEKTISAYRLYSFNPLQSNKAQV